jgi:hypothetical protein
VGEVAPRVESLLCKSDEDEPTNLGDFVGEFEPLCNMGSEFDDFLALSKGKYVGSSLGINALSKEGFEFFLLLNGRFLGLVSPTSFMQVALVLKSVLPGNEGLMQEFRTLLLEI